MTKSNCRKGLFPALMAAATLCTFSATSWAQTTATRTRNPDDPFINAPRFELGVFGGGQFWYLSQNRSTAPNYLVSGGVFGARFSQDVTRHFGFEEDWSFLGINNLRFSTTPGTPVQTVGFAGRNGQVFAGPVLYLSPPEAKVRPFVLVGPAYQYFYPTSDAKNQARSTGLPYSAFRANQLDNADGAALVYGVGMKINATHRLGMRFDARGIFTKNPHFGLPGISNGPGTIYVPPGGIQNGIQVTFGISYRFGYKPPVAPTPPPPPPPPPVRDFNVSLSASPSDVCPGDSVTVTASASGLPGGVTPTFSWTVGGQAVSGTSSYTFTPQATTTVNVTANAPQFNAATGSTTVTVRPYAAPHGSVTANPSSLTVGQSSTLSSSFDGTCGGQIAPATYRASEGSVNGNTFDSTNVQFDPSNNDEQTKTVTITATATDAKGGTGTATTTINVRKPANIKATRLPDLIFAPNSARVNNCGKRLLLEQLKTYLDRDPTGRVVFVGHTTDRETRVRNLDRQRALNAAAVISGGKGICLNFAPTQILIDAEGTKQNGVDYQPFFCGGSASPRTRERAGSAVSANDKTAQYRRVEVYFVPTNAQLPSTVTNTSDAASLNVKALGCPK